MKITFTQLTESHFPLLLKWLEAEHVKIWWDQDIHWTNELISKKYADYVKGYKLVHGTPKPINPYIICIDERPVGYIQLYNAYDFPRSKPLLGFQKNLGAFDIFIGDEKYLKKNIGSMAITKFFNLYAHQYSHIFVDPDAGNTAAIKSYEKAGFRRLPEQKEPSEMWMLWENKVVSVNNAEHFVWGDHCDGWWLKKGKSFTAIEETMPPGGLEVKHFHNITEQFFYVLNGMLYIEMDNHEHQLQNHQGLTIPSGVVHQVFNKSKELVRFLVISCPDSHGDRVNVEDEKPESIGDNGLTFSDIPDRNFDDKIDKALYLECKKLTGIKTNFERVSVYLKQNKETVAGALCYIHGKILWCDSIYVEEPFQNKGFGHQLISELLEIASARDLREIQLNTYFPKALAFFKKCGFEEVAVVPNWKYDLTCYLMRKII